MITAYVVDDERLAVERLTRLLNATGRVTIAGSSTDPEAAVSDCDAHIKILHFVQDDHLRGRPAARPSLPST